MHVNKNRSMLQVKSMFKSNPIRPRITASMFPVFIDLRPLSNAAPGTDSNDDDSTRLLLEAPVLLKFLLLVLLPPDLLEFSEFFLRTFLLYSWKYSLNVFNYIENEIIKYYYYSKLTTKKI